MDAHGVCRNIIQDNLGIAYENNQVYEKAKEAYKRTLELDPDDPEIKKHLIKIQNKTI